MIIFELDIKIIVINHNHNPNIIIYNDSKKLNLINNKIVKFFKN
jgi:hypothetical protein